MDQVSNNPSIINSDLMQTRLNLKTDFNCKETSELILLILKDLILNNIFSEELLNTFEGEIKKYFDGLIHNVVLLKNSSLKNSSSNTVVAKKKEAEFDREQVQIKVLKSLTLFLSDYLEERKLLKEKSPLNLSKQLPQALQEKNLLTIDLTDNEILKSVSEELSKVLLNKGIDPELVKIIESHLPKLLHILINTFTESKLVPTIINAIVQNPKLPKEISDKLNSNSNKNQIQETKITNSTLSPELLKELENMAVQFSHLSEADFAFDKVKETIYLELQKNFSQSPAIDPSNFVKIGRIIKDTLWKGDQGKKTVNAKVNPILPEEIKQKSQFLYAAFSQTKEENTSITSKLKNAIACSFGEKVMENLLDIILNPELMQLYVIRYLVPQVILPILTEANKNVSQPLPSLNPHDSLHNEQRVEDVKKEVYEKEFCLEGTKLISNIMKAYLFDYILKHDVPLSDEIKDISLEFINKIISTKLKEGAAIIPSENTQLLFLKLFSTVPSFLSDYSTALKNLENTSATYHAYSNRKEKALIAEINKIRMQKGLPSLSLDESKQQEKLIHLAEMSTCEIKENATQQVEKETLIKIAPLILYRILSTISEPKNIQILLKEILTAPKEVFNSEGTTGYTPKVIFSDAVKKQWLKTIQETVYSFAKLLKTGDQNKTINPELIHKFISGLNIINVLTEDTLPSPHFLANFEGCLSNVRWLNKILISEKQGEPQAKIQWTLESEQERQLQMELPKVIEKKLGQELSLKKFVDLNTINLPFSEINLAEKIAPIADRLIKEALGKPFDQHIRKELMDKLLELLSYKKLLGVFIYEYIFYDCLEEILKTVQPQVGLYSDKMLSKMSSDQFLGTLGSNWTFPSENNGNVNLKKSFISLIADPKWQSNNLQIPFSTILEWEEKKIINENAKRNLIDNFWHSEIFLLQSNSILDEFKKRSLITVTEVDCLTYLLQKGEVALVYTYLDCKAHLNPSFLGKSDWGVESNELENALALYVKTPSASPLFNHLRTLHCKNKFAFWFESIKTKYPNDFEAFSENLQEDLEGKKHGIAIIETTLKYIADIKSLSFNDKVMVKELQTTINSPEAEGKLPLIFSKLNQIHFWKNTLDTLHHSWKNQQMTPEMLMEVRKFYENFSTLIAPVITAPLSNPLQISLLKTLRTNLDKLLTVKEDKAIYQGQVLADSKSSNQMKLSLIEKAQKRIIFSGCYCGGEFFDQVLDAIKKRLLEQNELKVDFISSEIFLTKSNIEKINKLKQKQPTRFSALITPELAPVFIYHSNTLSCSTNHSKAMIVDGHVII